jgi:hypothetical protein
MFAVMKIFVTVISASTGGKYGVENDQKNQY